MSQHSDLLLRGGQVVTNDPALGVSILDIRVSQGRIVELGRDLRGGPNTEEIDARGHAVVPGLIHGHIHLCQVLFRHIAEDRPLLPWLSERIWPLEAAHTPDSLRASARLGIAELLLSGATCALDMGTVHHHDAVFEAAEELGIRLQSGKAMMDAGDEVPDGLRETAAESIAQSDRLRARWEGAAEGRLTYAYAPRFVPSCSGELLSAVADRLEAGARLHTHASENADEIAYVRSLTGKDNVEHLHDLRLLTPRSVIAHGVHLTADERALLARTGASIAHCPSANLKLASGVADVPALLEAGVNVALGADGAPCNNNLDLWREMKLAGLLPRVTRGARALAAQRVFEAATLGGARALGLDAQVGRLSVGYRADLALVDLSGPHLQPLPAQPDGRLWTALVYAVAASDVRTVVVDGRVVVRGGQLQTADGREIGRAALREQEALLVRAGLSAQA